MLCHLVPARCSDRAFKLYAGRFCFRVDVCLCVSKYDQNCIDGMTPWMAVVVCSLRSYARVWCIYSYALVCPLLRCP